jgi:hypothetical protein
MDLVQVGGPVLPKYQIKIKGLGTMRRSLVTTVGIFLAAALASGSVQARKLDLSNPEDALVAFRKIQCSAEDLKPVVYHWVGKVYSRVQGEPDRHLFGVQGMNIRQCVTVEDPKRGKGVRMVSRELMFYLDPATGEVLKTWNNPWTGQSVDVFHVANDPVNFRAPMFPIDDKGAPYSLNARVENGRVFMNIEVPLFYKNPMAGDYQDYVGNQYHAMEIFDFVVDQADLIDGSKPRANASVAWVRLAEWLPWMKMSGRNGVMVTNATGQTVANIEALPPVILDQIKASYPTYMTPPPADDTRPNETSWTYFKKIIDAKKAAADPAPKP